MVLSYGHSSDKHIDHVGTPYRLAVPLLTALLASTVGRTGRFGYCPKLGTGHHFERAVGFLLFWEHRQADGRIILKWTLGKYCAVCVSGGSSCIASEWPVAVTVRCVACCLVRV